MGGVGQLRTAKITDRLHPVAGEIGLSGPVAPSPGLVGGMEQDLARSDVLQAEDRQTATDGTDARRMFGQDPRARLQCRQLQ